MYFYSIAYILASLISQSLAIPLQDTQSSPSIPKLRPRSSNSNGTLTSVEPHIADMDIIDADLVTIERYPARAVSIRGKLKFVWLNYDPETRYQTVTDLHVVHSISRTPTANGILLEKYYPGTQTPYGWTISTDIVRRRFQIFDISIFNDMPVSRAREIATRQGRRADWEEGHVLLEHGQEKPFFYFSKMIAAGKILCRVDWRGHAECGMEGSESDAVFGTGKVPVPGNDTQVAEKTS